MTMTMSCRTSSISRLGPSRRVTSTIGRQTSSRFVVRSSNADVAAAIKSLALKGRVPIEEAQQDVDVIESSGKGVFLPDSWDGLFVQTATTDLNQVEPNGVATLGRMSFNTWHPNDMKVKIHKALLYKGEEDGVPNTYRNITVFSTLDGVEGFSSVVGEFSLNKENENRINVGFKRVELGPPDGISEEGLAKWMTVFKEANPTMDETGKVVIELPKAPKGFLDILYMDDNVQITRGNKNTVSVVKRVNS